VPLALVAAVVVVGAGPVTAGPATAAGTCRIDYDIASQWPGGYVGTVTLTNLGDPLPTWTIGWTFPGDQQISSAWNATIGQSQNQVTAVNASWNAALGTGATTSFGFQAGFGRDNPAPTTFTLNGEPCTGQATGGDTGPGTPTDQPTTAGPTTPAQPAVTPTRSAAAPTTAWPTATGTETLTATKAVSGTLDGQLRRYVGGGALGDGGQDESQDPLFRLSDGAVLENVIIGSPAADGVHCAGTCTLRNVWWEDVGEDAATLKGSSATQVMTVQGGGARHASDKVFQHNGPGTFVIDGFQVSDFGKLYRSCGNCSSQYRRTVRVTDVTVTAPGKTLVGINTNYGDTATLSGITVVGDSSRKIKICERFQGNDSGDEPTSQGSGPGDGCGYTPSEIVYR
jgi:hypothetical protein